MAPSGSGREPLASPHGFVRRFRGVWARIGHRRASPSALAPAEAKPRISPGRRARRPHKIGAARSRRAAGEAYTQARPPPSALADPPAVLDAGSAQVGAHIHDRPRAGAGWRPRRPRRPVPPVLDRGGLVSVEACLPVVRVCPQARSCCCPSCGREGVRRAGAHPASISSKTVLFGSTMRGWKHRL